MKRMKLSDESGAVVVEATYIVFFVTLIVGLLIGFLLVIFQKYQLQAIANETSSRIGRIYPYVDVDTKTQRVSQADIENSAKIFSSSGLYRNIIGDNFMKTTNETRAEDHTEYALEGVSLIKPQSYEISAQVYSDTYAVRHIEVTVTAVYKVPLGGFFRFFGLKETVTYAAVGRAQCVDMVDYINAISYARFVDKEFEDLPILGDIKVIAENVKKLCGG